MPLTSIRSFARIVYALLMVLAVQQGWASERTSDANSYASLELNPRHNWQNCHFAMSNWFYAYKWENPEAQVQVLAEQGYEGIMLSLKDEPKRWAKLPEYLESLKKHNIKLTAIHCRFYLEDGTYPEVIKQSLPLLKDSGVLLCPSVNTRGENVDRRDPQAIRLAVKTLRQMSTDAKKYGLGGVAPYMHVGNWVESIDDSLFIAKLVDEPNFGVMFHLHHWQQTCGTFSYEKLQQDLQRAANYLMIVVIQGSDEDAFSHLVVGEGTFDLRPLIETLVNVNYQGALGSMGYTQKGDIPAKLRAGRIAWAELVGQFNRK